VCNSHRSRQVPPKLAAPVFLPADGFCLCFRTHVFTRYAVCAKHSVAFCAPRAARDRPSKAPVYAAGAGVTLRGRGSAFVRAFHHLKRAHRAITDAFAAYHTGLFIYHRQRKHGFLGNGLLGAYRDRRAPMVLRASLGVDNQLHSQTSVALQQIDPRKNRDAGLYTRVRTM